MQFLSKKKKNHFLLKVLGIIIFLVLVSFVVPGLRSFSQNIFSGVFKKTTQIDTTVDKELKSMFRSKRSLFVEVQNLKKENEKLALDLQSMEQIKKENQELQAVFARTQNTKERVPLLIIAKPNQSAYDTLIVSKDTNKNIEPGMFVLSEPESVIGTVESISKNSALVKLFSTSDIKTFGRLERNNQDVTLIGRGGGNFIVEVPVETEVLVGDRILYPALNNMPLGVVRGISNDDRNPSKILHVTTAVNILELARVYILLN